MTEHTDPSSSARSKRYRERKKDGEMVVRLEVDAAARAGLVRCGFVAPGDADSRDEIAKAVEMLLDGMARNCLAFATGWVRTLPCASRVAACLPIGSAQRPR